MVRQDYFNSEEQEATDKELQAIAFTALSIASTIAILLVALTIYFIT